ncbi:helix-turn-helix transcriptional regulator [Acidithiobacillus thiooxidans]|uniref:helix-turn-helix transcriptional regulator n=1 Tax=Acidithiobacillus thiooxidans TaxID=930 RepID=UPI003568A8C1
MPKKIETPAVPETLDRLPAVLERVGASKTTLYAQVKAGTFPAPVKIGQRAVAWKRSDVDAWISSRVSSNAS